MCVCVRVCVWPCRFLFEHPSPFSVPPSALISVLGPVGFFLEHPSFLVFPFSLLPTCRFLRVLLLEKFLRNGFCCVLSFLLCSLLVRDALGFGLVFACFSVSGHFPVWVVFSFSFPFPPHKVPRVLSGFALFCYKRELVFLFLVVCFALSFSETLRVC